MNWKLLLPLSVTAVVAFLNTIIYHCLVSARDQRNKRREARLRFLIDAYQRLEANASRGMINDTKYADDFESAIADIKFFGTTDQCRMAKDLSCSIAIKDPDATSGPLLQALRDDIRKELELEPLGEELFHFRVAKSSEQSGFADDCE